MHPITKQVKTHNGIDFAAPQGSNVYAIASGTITEFGYDDESGFFIVVESENNIITKYASLDDKLIHKKDKVKQGDIIGYVGNTGKSTGSHLHIEITHNGKLIDPEMLLFKLN